MFISLKKGEQVRVIKAIKIFSKNPFDTRLRNHELQGKLQGKRAISVGGNLRIVFEEKNGYIEIIFLKVGTHNQVY